jgi:hypothetical protein
LKRIAMLIAVAVVGCADAGIDSHSDDATQRQDSLGNPTDTNVVLELGLWHDNVLVPGEGFHLYHFTADASGWVAFQMQAPLGHPNLWSYLRIVDPANNHEVWASVGNKRTNLCEVIIDVDEGHEYDVIVTSQENSLLPAGAKQVTNGPYTGGVSPVAISFP